MSEDKIRILIVDDHAMVRSSMALFLNTMHNMILIGEAADGKEAVKKYQELKPDVVLMDLKMPIADGVTAIENITKLDPCARIIALSSFKDDELVHNALEAGAMSYLLKNATLSELTTAIEAIVVGESVLAPEVTKILIAATRKSKPSAEPLTPREQDIIQLMIDGMTNRQIAQHLDIGLSTVKFHVSSILSKLNASSRTEAVSIALKQRILATS